MIRLKAFTSKGKQQFLDYLLKLKTDSSVEKISIDKNDEVINFGDDIWIDENKIFANRLELAEYVEKVFNDSGFYRKDVLNDPKLWTWLAYCWFNQVCPSVNGERKVGQIERYINNKDDYKTYYRHLIQGPYNVYTILGRENAKLFLSNPLDKPGDLYEQTASRQKIITVQTLMAVANILYWDHQKKQPKKSASNRNVPGNIRRLGKWFLQIILTYDIYTMEAKNILLFLPHEFNQWKAN